MAGAKYAMSGFARSAAWNTVRRPPLPERGTVDGTLRGKVTYEQLHEQRETETETGLNLSNLTG